MLWSILSSRGVWERYIIYCLHMEGMPTTGLQFQIFAVYLPSHEWRAMGTGMRYSLTTPSPVFSRLIQDGGYACLPASQSQPRQCRLFPNPLVTWFSPQLSPSWFKMADFRAYLHPNHSPENVVFSLVLLSRDPLPGFLPAYSRWRICVLTCITITAPKMSSFPNPLITWPNSRLSPGWFKMADFRAYLSHNHFFFLIIY